jgi:hypothetical protein
MDEGGSGFKALDTLLENHTDNNLSGIAENNLKFQLVHFASILLKIRFQICLKTCPAEKYG